MASPEQKPQQAKVTDTTEIKHIKLSEPTRNELTHALNSEEEKGPRHLAFSGVDGKVAGVIVDPTSYEFFRSNEDMLTRPEEYGLKIKQLRDRGPSFTIEETFGEKPIPRSKIFRTWFYEQRLKAYRAVGLRSSEGAQVNETPVKLVDVFKGTFPHKAKPTSFDL